ncbi:MAG TPA: hypothetical protein VFB12_28630 [Ktedonobacteraceae bacterium]|nr:hypothetical protein [Ktedonobacteraceae bacterium]
MPFTARDLRYNAEQSYPLLYAYLHRNAQRYLGALKYDAFEVDTVIGHVVEQLVRLGLLGGDDRTSLTALDRLTDAQFYTFLSRSVRNKSIDRLRKRRLQVSTAAELESMESDEGEDHPLEDAVESVWGTTPFSTPEEISLHLVSQRNLRDLLKHCIKALGAAPNQLQAVIEELREIGADDLLKDVGEELHVSVSSPGPVNPHISQHKDHAHKKLRNCLQQQSTNLTVMIALRLTEYKNVSSQELSSQKVSSDMKLYTVDIQTLAQKDLSEDEVRKGLNGLVTEGLLDWHGEDVVQLTTTQMKRLTRFYKEEE